MNDALVLRSAIDLMDSMTTVCWNNKYKVPEGYSYNEMGYVITNEPRPMIKACVGVVFGFLVKRLGVMEYVRQNLIALRLLNVECHKSIVGGALYHALKKSMIFIDREKYNEILDEVYSLTSVPLLDSNFITWRRTWFSETCAYDTISKIIQLENHNKIDSDRELMTVDKKYITKEVALFTGFSRSRIDKYWSEKQWDKKLRTLYTLDEAVTELSRAGIDNPNRKQLSEVSGLSVATISGAMKDIKKMMEVRALNETNTT